MRIEIKHQMEFSEKLRLWVRHSVDSDVFSLSVQWKNRRFISTTHIQHLWFYMRIDRLHLFVICSQYMSNSCHMFLLYILCLTYGHIYGWNYNSYSLTAALPNQFCPKYDCHRNGARYSGVISIWRLKIGRSILVSYFTRHISDSIWCRFVKFSM